MQAFGNGGAEERFPLVDRPDGRADIAGGSLLDEITLCTGFDRLDDIRFIAVRGKHEHLGGGNRLENLAGGLQAIERGMVTSISTNAG